MLAAVYGTLKSNKSANKFLRDSRMVFSGFVSVNFEMFRNSSYPMLVPSDSKHDIFIEVYDINDEVLEDLDSYEGCPYLYVRKEVFFEELSTSAFIYVYNRKIVNEILITEGIF